MQPRILPKAAGIVSLIFLIADIFCLKFFFNPQFIPKAPPAYYIALKIFINILIFIIWSSSKKKMLPLAASLVGMYGSIGYLSGYYKESEPYFILSLLVSITAGYLFHRRFAFLEQGIYLKLEKVEEELNLARNESSENMDEITHLENRLLRYINLSELTERFNSTLKENEITKIIVEDTYNLFGKSDRVMLFLVDTAHQELNLMVSKRMGQAEIVKYKKGDIFDRWVFWKRQPLLIEDMHKDFRFSREGKKMDDSFASLISAPLISGNKVLGILRMDSSQPQSYSQEDLRLLDVVAGIAAVALENSFLYKRVSDLAIRDGLTMLYVQKYFKERLSEEVERHKKTKEPFSVIFMDIDNFKDYNDKYGHMAGDLVLRYMSALLEKKLAGGDIAARYGGEEFACLLLGKNMKEAVRFANNLKDNITEMPVVLRRDRTHIAVSMGVSSCPADGADANDLLVAADRRLYKAKEKGKNAVCSD